MNDLLYPRTFEIYRLEALGDDPYLTVDAAREQYESGRGLTVIPADQPIAWSLDVSSKAFRFSVSFHTEHKTPVRRVTWEQIDGMLFCRRIIDRFYPEGEEQTPLIDAVAVVRGFSTDGVLELTVRTPGNDDGFTQIDGVATDGLRHPVPEFGDWHPLVEASRPPELTRTAAGATAVAHALVAQAMAAGADGGAIAGSMWRIPMDAEVVIRRVEALVEGLPGGGIPTITRGAARIVPLAVQIDSQAGDPREQRHRMRTLADGIDGACEHRAGRGVRVDLDRTGRDEVAAYAAALRAAGATDARCWVLEPSQAVVLVWTGDGSSGDLSLALHLVPTGWVSDRRTGPASSDPIDVRWSWADAVALVRERSAPVDSVAGQDQTS